MTKSETLKDLFRIMRDRKLRQKCLPVRPETVSRYKQGSATPRITTVEELGASIGLRLQWVEIEN
jgi:hypothetical protein